MTSRIILKDIAREAQVHLSTVSLALRNDPRLSQNTREKIQRLAQEMGYTPDASLSALSAYRNALRPHPLQSELAFLTDSSFREKHVGMQAVYVHMQQRASELGYNLEEFVYNEKRISLDRMRRIWRQRNIRGILIGPFNVPGTTLETDWSELAVVAWGFSIEGSCFNRSSTNQYSNMIAHLQALRDRGYERIGLHLPDSVNSRSGHLNHAAYLLAQATHMLPPIPILIDKDPSPALLKRWIRANRIDCIISYIEQYQQLDTMGYISPDKIGFSKLSWGREGCVNKDVSGFDERTDLVARGAVDFVVSLIHNQTFGVLKNPRYMTVVGEFHEGITTRPLILNPSLQDQGR